MEIYTLIGASGTGKSHNALNVAKEYDIDAIVDDGILIMNGKRMAGHSAKMEQTTIGAVKCAIFNDPKDAQEMRDAIWKLQPKKVLILGTSERMVERIATTLDLPEIKKKIFIQEISSQEQIEEALKMRESGKHVIPLPNIEVKKDISSALLDSLVNFFTKKDNKGENERSIVRPKFSQLGTLTIADTVIEQIVSHVVSSFKEFGRGSKVSVEMDGYGVNIFCEMKVRYGVAIQAKVAECQKEIIVAVDRVTGLNVKKIDMRITAITA